MIRTEWQDKWDSATAVLKRILEIKAIQPGKRAKSVAVNTHASSDRGTARSSVGQSSIDVNSMEKIRRSRRTSQATTPQIKAKSTKVPKAAIKM